MLDAVPRSARDEVGCAQCFRTVDRRPRPIPTHAFAHRRPSAVLVSVVVLESPRRPMTPPQDRSNFTFCTARALYAQLYARPLVLR